MRPLMSIHKHIIGATIKAETRKGDKGNREYCFTGSLKKDRGRKSPCDFR